MKRRIVRLIGSGVAALVMVACQLQTPTPAPTPTVFVSTATPTAASTSASFIAVVPEQAGNGDPITIVGTAWPATYNIALEMRPSTANATSGPVSLGTVAADNAGHFRFVGIVPQAAAAGE